MILFNYILIYNTFYQREGRHDFGAPFFNENKNIYLKVEFNPLPVTKYHIKQTAKSAVFGMLVVCLFSCKSAF